MMHSLRIDGTTMTGRFPTAAMLCALLAGTALPCAAQSSLPQSPGGSLVENPQQGATPQPLRPSPTLPPPPAPTLPEAATPAPLPPPVVPQTIGGIAPYGPASPRPMPLWTQDVPGGLPAPDADPMRVDAAADPILALAHRASPLDAFRSAVAAAVQRNPGLDESIAQRAEAQAARNEARARQYPVADLSLSSFRVVSRAFSNDPNNVLERSRPRERTDGTLRIQQPIVDFGASSGRIRAGNDRLQAAITGVEDTATQIALQAVAAWYNVYGYRVMVRLSETFAAGQRELRGQIDRRVAQGVAAPGDVAQVDGYIASAEAQLADFRRSLSGAEAQYAAVVGLPAPATLDRAPVPDLSVVAADRMSADVATLPRVRAARSTADAAGRDARALKADMFPQLTGGVDAGRYGVVENARDYDIRANLTLSMRIGGGAKQRIDQALARSSGAEARFRRTRQEAERDAQVAFADVTALEAAREAIEANYMASRRSRDVLAERFRVSRGTLFDLLAAQSNYFGVATRYIQTLTDLDSARYVLLARTGKLLGALGLDPAALDPR